MNENKTTLDSEIRKMFKAGVSQKSIHKHLEGKHVSADIANAIQVVRTEIDLEEKKKELAKRAVLEAEIRESVYRLAKEFEDNDKGRVPCVVSMSASVLNAAGGLAELRVVCPDGCAASHVGENARADRRSKRQLNRLKRMRVCGGRTSIEFDSDQETCPSPCHCVHAPR